MGFKKSHLDVAVLGATGAVGKEFLKLLDERETPIKNLRLFASSRSAGIKVDFRGKPVVVHEPLIGCFEGCDVAFFSAGSNLSEIWGPVAVSEGCFVIDNSAAFRMQKGVPLVVPEVNPHMIPHAGPALIIANPNCSTIQLVVALQPLQKNFGIKNVTVSTYQSVSGAGAEGVEELIAGARAFLDGKTETTQVFPHSIAFNNIPHIDVFDESGFTKEEIKIMDESRKIMELPHLDISATTVRTPTLNSHSEAVWVELNKEVTRQDILNALNSFPGIKIVDDPEMKKYPLNRDASGKDEVFIGRIRKDLSNPKRWVMWVVSDNLRKGAALNGIQIAEKLFLE